MTRKKRTVTWQQLCEHVNDQLRQAGLDPATVGVSLLRLSGYRSLADIKIIVHEPNSRGARKISILSAGAEYWIDPKDRDPDDHFASGMSD